MQINIDGDPLPTNDFAYATQEGLVPSLVERTGEAGIKANGLTGPFDEIEFEPAPLINGEGKQIVDRARLVGA